MKRPLEVDEAVAGLEAGHRATLARAITLVESTVPAHRERAEALLARIAPATHAAWRVGVTGVPGAGKSTLLDALGVWLLDQGRRVAVLAVDPSSALTGGSILGDKTRMVRLANDPRAYVRPSPAAGTLGGAARRTREATLVCAAAGFDVVFVETVGVGQSETRVADMVDTFLVLALPGSGDELQGIKKGVLELADVVAVTKADGENLPRARLARQDLEGALRYGRARLPGWRPPTCLVSGLTGDGLPELWRLVAEHRAALEREPGLEAHRAAQRVGWLWTELDERVRDELRAHPQVRALQNEVEAAVRAGRTTPACGARTLYDAWRSG